MVRGDSEDLAELFFVRPAALLALKSPHVRNDDWRFTNSSGDVSWGVFRFAISSDCSVYRTWGEIIKRRRGRTNVQAHVCDTQTMQRKIWGFPCSPSLGLVVGACRGPGGYGLLRALLLLDIIQLNATDDRARSYR